MCVLASSVNIVQRLRARPGPPIFRVGLAMENYIRLKTGQPASFFKKNLIFFEPTHS